MIRSIERNSAAYSVIVLQDVFCTVMGGVVYKSDKVNIKSNIISHLSIITTKQHSTYSMSQ